VKDLRNTALLVSQGTERAEAWEAALLRGLGKEGDEYEKVGEPGDELMLALHGPVCRRHDDCGDPEELARVCFQIGDERAGDRVDGVWRECSLA
jgi:hypothetical protein